MGLEEYRCDIARRAQRRAFPPQGGRFLVESDAAGNSLFESHNRALAARIEGLYQGLKPPALHRYGETDDRKDALI